MSKTVHSDQPQQGPTEEYCPASREGHTWTYLHHAGDPPLETRKCIGCTYHSVAPIREYLERRGPARGGPVHHPAHYNVHPSGIECIDVVEWMSFNAGNAIKYLWRAGEKDATPKVLDLQKAMWYIEREIERLRRVPAPPPPIVIHLNQGV